MGPLPGRARRLLHRVVLHERRADGGGARLLAHARGGGRHRPHGRARSAALRRARPRGARPRSPRHDERTTRAAVHELLRRPGTIVEPRLLRRDGRARDLPAPASQLVHVGRPYRGTSTAPSTARNRRSRSSPPGAERFPHAQGRVASQTRREGSEPSSSEDKQRRRSSATPSSAATEQRSIAKQIGPSLRLASAAVGN